MNNELRIIEGLKAKTIDGLKLKFVDESKLRIGSKGLGIDFGERFLFILSDGRLFIDLTKEEVIELAVQIFENYIWVCREDFHPNSMYDSKTFSNDKVDKFLLLGIILDHLFGKFSYVCPKHQTSIMCSDRSCKNKKGNRRYGLGFKCSKCDFKFHADFNAACNVHDRGEGLHKYLLGTFDSGNERVGYLQNVSRVKKICSTEGCEKFACYSNSELCKTHYDKERSIGTLVTKEQRFCSVEGCDKSVHGQGLCQRHYNAKYRAGTLVAVEKESKICSIKGCKESACAKGLCKTHYNEERKTGELKEGKSGCKVPMCNKKYFTRGFCQVHYDSATRNGINIYGLPED